MYFHNSGIDYSDLTKRYVPREDNRGYGNNQVLMRDYTSQADIETVLSEIADQITTRLRKHNVLGEVIGISVGFSEPDEQGHRGWSTQTKVDPTNETNDLIKTVKYLFEQRWQVNALRNLGIRVNKIGRPTSFQISLFEDVKKHDTNLCLEHTIDQIRFRYGYKALVRVYSKTSAGTAIERASLIGGHQA